MSTPKANALIGQSGGPTAVINQSLVGIVEACMASDKIGEVYGALQGINGAINEDLINLGDESPASLELIAATPCAALRSIRHRPTHEDCERVLEVLRAHDIRYFFYIGGNDSSESALILERVAQDANYDLHLIHVPKTIDNDLMVTDHCPGYGSAARFVAQAVMGDNEDNRSLGGVKIDVIMGRHAGWLTAAASLGRQSEEEGPHLVYVPEAIFNMDEFLEDVGTIYSKYGRCLIAVSEGIDDVKGKLLRNVGESDEFGNVQLSGSGFLGDLLAASVREALGPQTRVRADTFGYLQRSYFGVCSEVDARESREVGREAVRTALAGRMQGSMVILREPGDEYSVRYDCTDLSDVAAKTKVLDAGYLAGNNGIAESFRAYAMPLLGSLPRPGRLTGRAIKKRLNVPR